MRPHDVAGLLGTCAALTSCEPREADDGADLTATRAYAALSAAQLLPAAPPAFAAMRAGRIGSRITDATRYRLMCPFG